MYKRIFLFLSILFAFQTSCTEKSNDLLPPADQKINLFSFFTINKAVKFQASYSAAVTDSIWDTNFRDAQLFLTADKDTLTTNYLGNGLFLSTNSISSDVSTVSFMFLSKGDSLTASDIIPEKPTNVNITIADELFLEGDLLPWISLKIEYDKVLNTETYYEAELYMITDETTQKCILKSTEPVITGQTYYPEIEEFTGSQLSTLVYPAKFGNSEKEQIQILYGSPIVIQESTGNNYIPDHQLVVCFRSISNNYYKYKSSYLEQIIKREGDIIFGGSSGIDVFSNISGGYGIFAGYSEFSDTIEVERIYY